MTKSVPENFEAAMVELEQLVKTAESSRLPLQQMLASYQRGINLVQFCYKELAQLEEQIQNLDQAFAALPALTNDLQDGGNN